MLLHIHWKVRYEILMSSKWGVLTLKVQCHKFWVRDHNFESAMSRVQKWDGVISFQCKNLYFSQIWSFITEVFLKSCGRWLLFAHSWAAKLLVVSIGHVLTLWDFRTESPKWTLKWKQTEIHWFPVYIFGMAMQKKLGATRMSVLCLKPVLEVVPGKVFELFRAQDINSFKGRQNDPHRLSQRSPTYKPSSTKSKCLEPNSVWFPKCQHNPPLVAKSWANLETSCWIYWKE